MKPLFTALVVSMVFVTVWFVRRKRYDHTPNSGRLVQGLSRLPFPNNKSQKPVFGALPLAIDSLNQQNSQSPSEQADDIKRDTLKTNNTSPEPGSALPLAFGHLNKQEMTTPTAKADKIRMYTRKADNTSQTAALQLPLNSLNKPQISTTTEKSNDKRNIDKEFSNESPENLTQPFDTQYFKTQPSPVHFVTKMADAIRRHNNIPGNRSQEPVFMRSLFKQTRTQRPYRRWKSDDENQLTDKYSVDKSLELISPQAFDIQKFKTQVTSNTDKSVNGRRFTNMKSMLNKSQFKVIPQYVGIQLNSRRTTSRDNDDNRRRDTNDFHNNSQKAVYPHTFDIQNRRTTNIGMDDNGRKFINNFREKPQAPVIQQVFDKQVNSLKATVGVKDGYGKMFINKMPTASREPVFPQVIDIPNKTQWTDSTILVDNGRRFNNAFGENSQAPLIPQASGNQFGSQRASHTVKGDDSKIVAYELPNASQEPVFSSIGIRNKAQGTASTGNVDYNTIFVKSNVFKSYKK